MGFIGLDVEHDLASKGVFFCSWLLGGQAVKPNYRDKMLKTKVKDEKSFRMDIMPYEINMTEGQAWLHVRVHEPITKALALDLLKDTVEQATKHGVSNLLIDVRSAPSVKTTIDDFDIANYRLQELAFERSFKFAIVVDPEDKTHDFFETCTMNAGYNCRLFSDTDCAAQWLDPVQQTS
jgi:hypothetical protein